ncbi:hypothetical protein WJX74_003554 [Apatococcus lobatus]
MVYSSPPWCFSGRAFYQLQLVKLEEARKYIPPEFKIVSAFGHTLGGFYLARYSDSPVGAFDELVVLSGLIWDFPASCAWAARVYVNDKDARTHGKQHVGLPSRVASFSQRPPSSNFQGPHQTWWNEGLQTPAAPLNPGDYRASSGSAAISSSSSSNESHPEGVVIRNEERTGSRWPFRSGPRQLQSPVCCLSLPAAHHGRRGPQISLPLPSFSGGTADHPGLLQYTVQLKANMRPVKAARVCAALPSPEDGHTSSSEAIQSLLTGRPVIAFAFDNMQMTVAQPREPAKFKRRLEPYVPQLQAVC